MEDKLFCVLAIHNEEKYLPYSLQSVSDLGCKVVVVLDRCSDSSKLIVEQYLSDATIFCKRKSNWVHSIAEAKSVGCEIAKQMGAKIILISDADIILDVYAVKNALKRMSDFDCIVFGYKQYSLFSSVFRRIIDETHNLFCRFTHKLGIQPTRSGVYLIRTENISFEDKNSEYDYLQQKLKTVGMLTNTLHLRPRWDIKSQISRGVSRAGLPQYSLLKVILYCLFSLQPFTLAGYLKQKI